MIYRYVPNFYEQDKIKEKNISEEEFLNLQIKYKNSFENLLNSLIDFTDFDKKISELDFVTPTIDDMEFNFYHKFSSLASKYIFLRNNIYIENLSMEEIEIIRKSIQTNEYLTTEFLLSTFKKVLFEHQEYAFFGVPIQSNKIKAKSIIFEFAYKDFDCSISQGENVQTLFNQFFQFLNIILKDYFDSPIVAIINTGFNTSIYNINNDKNVIY